MLIRTPLQEIMIRIFLLLLANETLFTIGKVQKPSPEILPFNQLFTARLESGEGKLFYLLDAQPEGHPLSVTITPCSATVHWSVLFHDDGMVPSAEILRKVEEGGAKIIRGSEMMSFKLSAATPGLYLIPVWAPTAATTVQIFVSLDPGGPHDLTHLHLQNPHIKLSPLRRRKLSVRWQPSVVNPQHMNYCLVASTARVFSKLCEVEETLRLNNTTDHQITCVEKRNSAMLQHLQKSATYFVSLFATNAATQLTVPYGNSSVVMSSKVKPISLVDGSPKSVSLRKHQGRVNFRFRVGETGKDTHVYVVTCGGSVVVEILQRRHVVQRRRIAGYGRFIVLQPRKGDIYTIRVTAADAYHLTNIRSVEALATQSRSKFPLPEMPSVTDVHEYVSERACRSVTIGWVPSPGTRALYCVLVRRLPSHSHHSSLPLIADQCGLDARHKRTGQVANKCDTFTAGNNESVTTHVVTNLSRGTGYSIQVTVKKGKGRTLSYKLLNVFTKHSCD